VKKVRKPDRHKEYKPEEEEVVEEEEKKLVEINWPG
jgi:hypothetical protein